MIAISNQLDIDMQQVLRSVGYGVDCEPTGRVASFINEYVENACHLVEPSYTCVIRDVLWVQGSTVFVEGPVVLESGVIARLLKECEKVAIFALTIGERLEEMVRHLSEDGLMLQAAVLDAVGSVAAEAVAGFVQDKVEEIAIDQGLVISRRFSPGYCDWDIGEQEKVLRDVNIGAMGIRLTESCLMLPRKSISGIIGIGLYDANVANYNPCNTCKKRDCPGRR
ncbi:vitamin B12 dependent-methionine synthase activation domain-containing protein [Chloroflexota bacterium]